MTNPNPLTRHPSRPSAERPLGLMPYRKYQEAIEMSIKNSKSRLSKTLGIGQKQKNAPAPSTLSRAENLPVSGLKEDRSRINITREGNELRTFTPERDAERREAVQREAAALEAAAEQPAVAAEP